MHFEHLEEENYTWFDVVLDGAQLILDIVGTVAPAPIGTVANGINAAVSLSRGDYVGAATSAAMCAASLIPGGTIALGSGKLAKAAKAVTGTVTAITNAAEAGNKLAKAAMGVVHLVKFFKTAANALSSADAVLMGLQGAGNLYSNIVNGTFDPSDPTCWRDVIDIGRGVQVFIPERKDQKGTMDGDGQNLPHADGPTPDTPKHPDTSAPSKVSGQGAESGGTTTNNDTKPGSCCNGLEPVNLITGAYLVEQCDIILNDISGDFPLLRHGIIVGNRSQNPLHLRNGKQGGRSPSHKNRLHLISCQILRLPPDLLRKAFQVKLPFVLIRRKGQEIAVPALPDTEGDMDVKAQGFFLSSHPASKRS